MTLAGLMPDFRALFLWQQRQCPGQHLIDRQRAQTASHYQQTQRTFTAGKAFDRRHQLKNWSAYRIAGRDRIPSPGKSLRKGLQYFARQTCQCAVGHARNRILFMHHNRNA